MEYEALTVVRFAIMFGTCAGFTVAIRSGFTIEHLKGPQYTPPLWVTLQ